MGYVHGLYCVVVALELEGDEGGKDDEAYGAPHGVGDEEALGLVEDEVMAVARDGLVEVASLEEEEAHEEEGPRHDVCPPLLVFVAAEGYGMEAYHADDADAAQEVECMVALLHLSAVSLSPTMRCIYDCMMALSCRSMSCCSGLLSLRLFFMNQSLL